MEIFVFLGKNKTAIPTLYIGVFRDSNQLILNQKRGYGNFCYGSRYRTTAIYRVRDRASILEIANSCLTKSISYGKILPTIPEPFSQRFTTSIDYLSNATPIWGDSKAKKQNCHTHGLHWGFQGQQLADTKAKTQKHGYGNFCFLALGSCSLNDIFGPSPPLEYIQEKVH